jgi:hypothetical protein
MLLREPGMPLKTCQSEGPSRVSARIQAIWHHSSVSGKRASCPAIARRKGHLGAGTALVGCVVKIPQHLVLDKLVGRFDDFQLRALVPNQIRL